RSTADFGDESINQCPRGPIVSQDAGVAVGPHTADIEVAIRPEDQTVVKTITGFTKGIAGRRHEHIDESPRGPIVSQGRAWASGPGIDIEIAVRPEDQATGSCQPPAASRNKGVDELPRRPAEAQDVAGVRSCGDSPTCDIEIPVRSEDNAQATTSRSWVREPPAAGGYKSCPGVPRRRQRFPGDSIVTKDAAEIGASIADVEVTVWSEKQAGRSEQPTAACGDEYAEEVPCGLVIPQDIALVDDADK